MIGGENLRHLADRDRVMPYASRVKLTWRIVPIRQRALFIVVGYAVFPLLFFIVRTWLADGSSCPYGHSPCLLTLGTHCSAAASFAAIVSLSQRPDRGGGDWQAKSWILAGLTIAIGGPRHHPGILAARWTRAEPARSRIEPVVERHHCARLPKLLFQTPAASRVVVPEATSLTLRINHQLTA
jgi:hypothetical protein